MPMRLSANRVLPRYATGPEQAGAEATQWPRRMFAEGKDLGVGELNSLAAGIANASPKREDRIAFFLGILADESKPKPVRMASWTTLWGPNCFDYKHAGGQASSDVFSGLLALLKSNDGDLRKAGAEVRGQHLLFHRIAQDQVSRAKEAIASLDGAIEKEPDPGVREYMKGRRCSLVDLLNK